MRHWAQEIILSTILMKSDENVKKLHYSFSMNKFYSIVINVEKKCTFYCNIALSAVCDE